MPIEVIGLDADDTLWESEAHFVDVEERFRALISAYDSSDEVQKHLYAVERRNLEFFGYGVKSFTLSMIETAIQLTDGQVSGDDVATIVGWGKQMMRHPVDLLDGVADAVAALATEFRVFIITKGDLLHQEAKVAQSGLAELIEDLDVLTEKDTAAYELLLQRRGVDAKTFLMAGNSVKSDVLPVLALGAQGVHIPHGVTWEFENDHDGDPDLHGYHVVEALDEVGAIARSIT